MKIVADENIPLLMECFGALGEVIALPGRDMTTKDLQDVDALLVRSVTKVTESLIRNSTIKFVGTCTAGFDHVNHAYLANRGIAFTNAPGCNATSVVEYVLSALDILAEKDNFDLHHRTVGVVGKGQVGGRLYDILEQLGVKVYANDPLCEQNSAIRFLELDELIERCDVICLHTPLTTEGAYPTHHLIGKKQLDAMNPSTILISAGRGPVVDNEALKQALKKGQDLTVVLDVWEYEPDVDPELIQLVDIATPHIAGYSLDGKIRGTEMIYRFLCEYFELSDDLDVAAIIPAPALKQLEFSDSVSARDACSIAIRAVYDIRRDDSNMRKLIHRPEVERKQMFDSLRKNYAERREFNTLSISYTGSNKLLKRELCALGFDAALLNCSLIDQK
ncbi:4-phosphoerythronate dehydrogenase [Endozoicomonas sp. (ex Bugula neritina AB1)]|nr:4-phosphoerythronate dehydrogenase [Endozoicomonas sp. (ex Bugula neritina AB1)]